MDNSPLGALPAELRNYISELVLARDDEIAVDLPKGMKRSKRLNNPEPNRRKPERLPALTQTCKQLRIETIPLFYSCNRFAVSVGRPDHWLRSAHYAAHELESLINFLEDVPDRALRSITIAYFASHHYNINNVRAKPSRGDGLLEVVLAVVAAVKPKACATFGVRIEPPHAWTGFLRFNGNNLPASIRAEKLRTVKEETNLGGYEPMLARWEKLLAKRKL